MTMDQQPACTYNKTQSAHPKTKKTKSRNGCSRCKTKRLKCDETTPSCLQCKKRKLPCPGYEKTLKWSTKYEVLQPGQLTKPCSNPVPEAPTTNHTEVKDRTTSPEVERHFQALAAVLPAGKKPSEQTQKDALSEAPKSVDVPSSSGESSPEPRDVSPSDLEVISDTFVFKDHASLAPVIIDCLDDGGDMSMSDWSFDDLEGFHVDPGPLDCSNMDTEELYGMNDGVDDSVSSDSPRLSRSLLLDFYRLPSPSPCTMTMDNLESVLIQHYFKDVCVLFSSFDSVLNPFRTTIGRVYQDTPSIYFAILSMSAAHLANTFPTMATIGMEMQRKARDALNEELSSLQGGESNCTKPLLAIMLLGLTTSWHEVNDLGEWFLSTARSLILPKLIGNSDGEKKERNIQFFEECLIYWEMLMGFVSKNSITFTPNGMRSRGTGKKPPVAKPDGKIVPHPWTGIAPTVHVLFAEVGRLVRRECALNSKHSANNMRHRQENLQNATSLEEDLLADEFPTTEEIADLGDERTSKQDFVTMAEAYRCAGLLELYRVFPSLLRKRLETSWKDKDKFEFPSPRFETPYEETDIKLWLNSLAMHILDLIESIPTSSGTICTQQILLVTAASELQFVSSVDFFDVYANDVKVLEARNFAIDRLQEHALRLPSKPVRKHIELIKEVWRRQDNSGVDLWIDVVDDSEWQTPMV